MSDGSSTKPPDPSSGLDPQASRDTSREPLLVHEYDGIQEYDNPMPRWWKWMFWGSFYFSVGYFAHYHLTGNGVSVAESYEQDIMRAREREAQALLGTEINEETLGRLKADAKMMEDASKLFGTRCGPCHDQLGTGSIGPNLTDDHWIHGQPSLMNIHHIISEGLQTKGMPPWKRQLSPIEIGKLSAYVGTIVHTNLPGKGPEGSKLEPR